MYVLLSCCEWIMSATFQAYRPIWREGVTEVTEIGKRGPELWNIRRSTRLAPTLPPVSGGPTSVDRAPLPDAGRAENPHRRREERAPSPAVAGQPLPTLDASCPDSSLASWHLRRPLGYSLYAVGERSLFHTLRNAPSVMGRAPAKRKTTSPTMRSHSSLWWVPPIRNVRRRACQYPLAMESQSWITPPGNRSRTIMSARPTLAPQKPTRMNFSVPFHVASDCMALKQKTRTAKANIPKTPNNAACT